MQSLYWVFTLRCNDFCDHCYNNSGPRGEVVDTAELLKVIPNLPDDPGRIILSGGEPLTEMKKLLAIVKGLKQRYADTVPIWLQTNGDLLNDNRLKTLLDAGIDRFDIASLDRFHRQKGRHAERLKTLFERFGLVDKDLAGDRPGVKVYALWGANEDFFLGGNWARGRAIENNLSLLDPEHNFCSLWSGALGFLDEGSEQQEVHIQLYRLYPCCPTTLYDLGDTRQETVEALLERCRGIEAFQTLNKGDVYSLGKDEGLSSAFIRQRINDLGDVCLWCDEYFDKYYSGEKGERRDKFYTIEAVAASGG